MPRPRALPRFVLLDLVSSNLLLFLFGLLALRTGFAETAVPIPMKAERWIANGNATFTSGDHAPNGVLEISKGSVDVKDFTFVDGTIEFDMFLPDHGILGMRLRAQDRQNAEALYFRPKKDCNTNPDCMQYMPLEHGAFEWDLFPEYQTAAPIRPLSWNHFRLVVLGSTMRVYVNRSSQPTLRVNHMEGSALPGGLAFGGPAKYANLVITPAKPTSAATQTAPEPKDGFLRHWQISTASALTSVHNTSWMPRRAYSRHTPPCLPTEQYGGAYPRSRRA